MIKDYRIVSCESESMLEAEVNRLLSGDWIPQGGISCMPETEHSRKWYAQAMILEGDSRMILEDNT